MVALATHAPLSVTVGAPLSASSDVTVSVTVAPARASARSALTVRLGGVASNGAIESESVALLLPGLGSGTPEDTPAVFTNVPLAVALRVAVTTNWAEPPLARL